MSDFEDRTVFGRFGTNGEAEADTQVSPDELSDDKDKAADSAPLPILRKKSIYRLAAIRHSVTGGQTDDPIFVIPGWSKGIVWLWATAIVLLVVGSWFFRVEEISMGPGFVKPEGGAHPVLAMTSGIAVKVNAIAGRPIEKGAPMIEISSGNVKSAFTEATAHLSAVESSNAELRGVRDQAFAAQLAQLDERARSIARQEASWRESVALLERKHAALVDLGKHGLVSRFDLETSNDNIAQANRSGESLKQALAQVQTERALLMAKIKEDRIRDVVMKSEAKARVEAVDYLRQETVVLSPENGFVDAILIAVGDVVRQGQEVARVVQADAAMMVVAFLPERDRTRVKVGDVVRIEPDPARPGGDGEFSGVISRISKDISTADDIKDGIGDMKLEGAYVRVDISIAKTNGMMPMLGTKVRVCFVTDRKMPLVLVFPVLEKWLR
jgi:adhesin transport system membrane fusion protein